MNAHRLPPDTNNQLRDADPAFNGYTWTVAVYALALTILVMLLVVRHVRVAFLQVLPMAVATLTLSAVVSRAMVRRHLPTWSIAVSGGLAGAIGACATLALVLVVTGREPAVAFGRPDVQHRLLTGPLIGALFAAGLAQLARSRERERIAWERRAQALIEGERLQRERLLAELQLLQAQIEPHFLYNTLANLRQLVRTDAARALEMLEHLIRYFKLALPAFRSERLSLRDELALVDSYVAVLRERVEQGIRLQLDVPDALLALPVPSASLLCLVENAIKHGRPEDTSLPCLVHLSARASDDWLRLVVDDNGPGLQSPVVHGAPSTGTGLSNLRERLRLLYGDKAMLRLEQHSGGCSAVLELPLTHR